MPSVQRLPAPPRALFLGLWLLVLVGLLLRAWGAASLHGSYDAGLDDLLYAGQRRLAGDLTHHDFVNGTPAVAQLLYAPSAWLVSEVGSLRPHRLLMLALSLLGGGLLAASLRQLARLGCLTLRPGSLLPLFGGLLYVLFVALFPAGLSGLLGGFANALLLLALTLMLRAVGRPAGLGRRSRLELSLAGAALLLLVHAQPDLLSSLLLVGVLLLALGQLRRPLAWLVPLSAGALIAEGLLLLPYLAVPDGLAHAWTGAVQLPLERIRELEPEGGGLAEQLERLLRINVAGLPVALYLLVPGLELLRRAARGLGAGAAGSVAPDPRPLLLPAAALLFLLDGLLCLQRGFSGREDQQLLVVPLVLLICTGLASLESSPRRWRRGLALATVLLLSLILANNVLVSPLLHPPRGPRESVLALERDRAAVRRYVRSLPAVERSFTAPQDTGLHRELNQPAGTVGVGPRWSLDQQQLAPSWATRRLGLPSGRDQVCRQLTARPTRHLVWLRTDPDGPNTEAFLRACLAADVDGWEEISDQLDLRTGEVKVFRRRQPLPPPRPPLASPPPW